MVGEKEYKERELEQGENRVRHDRKELCIHMLEIATRRSNSRR